MNCFWYSLGSSRSFNLLLSVREKDLLHCIFESLSATFTEEYFSSSPSLPALEWLNHHPTLLLDSFLRQSKIHPKLTTPYLKTFFKKTVWHLKSSLATRITKQLHSFQLFQAVLRSSYTKTVVGDKICCDDCRIIVEIYFIFETNVFALSNIVEAKQPTHTVISI